LPLSEDDKLNKLEAINFSETPETFQVDGENCFVVKYDNLHAKGFAGYRSIENDLTTCIEYLDYLDKNQTDNPNQVTLACTMAMVITYGKCFSSAKKRTAGLKRGHIEKDLRESHDKIITYRNNYVAHASGAGEGNVNYIALYPNAKNKKILITAHPFHWSLSGFALTLRNEIRQIISNLLVHVREKMQKCNEKILEWVAQQDLDAMYEQFEKFNLDKNYMPSIRDGSYYVRTEITPDGRCLFKAEIQT